MKIIMLSMDKVWIDLAKAKGHTTFHGYVQDYRSAAPAVYYVSPSNTLGFMDGGIDNTYSRVMFPGIEPIIKQKIKQMGYETTLGRPYQPIGTAICTDTGVKTQYLISSPTMLLPQNVSETKNAFVSIAAVMELLRTMETSETDELIIPSMCCGWGGMSAQKSIDQICLGLGSTEPLDLHAILHSQPKYYSNTEWVPSDGLVFG